MELKKYLPEKQKSQIDSLNYFVSIFAHNLNYIFSKKYRQITKQIDKQALTSHDFDIQVGILFSKLKTITHKKKHAYQFIDELVSKLAEFKTKQNYYDLDISLYKNAWEFKKTLKIKVTYNKGKLNSYRFYIVYSADAGWSVERDFKF